MKFHKQDYFSYLIVGSTKCPYIYDWDAWSKIYPLLNPLVTSSRGKPGVRSRQQDMITDKTILFGRMGWNDQSQQKWTHNSPQTAKESSHWSFIDTEIWAPHWNACAREDAAPDLFVHIVKPQLEYSNHVFLVAIHETLHNGNFDKVTKLLKVTAQSINSLATGR